MNKIDDQSLFNRKGVFVIHNEILYRNPESVMALMSKVIVIRAEHLLMIHGIEYNAYSPLFREISQGEIIPTYEVITDSENNIYFEEQKLEN